MAEDREVVGEAQPSDDDEGSQEAMKRRSLKPPDVNECQRGEARVLRSVGRREPGREACSPKPSGAALRPEQRQREERDAQRPEPVLPEGLAADRPRVRSEGVD